MGMIDNYCTIVGFQRPGGKPFEGYVFGQKNGGKKSKYMLLSKDLEVSIHFLGHIVTGTLGPWRARVRMCASGD